MRSRCAASIVSVASIVMLLGACSDDDQTTTLAKGEDVELVGDADLGGQTLDIIAEEKDDKVTGEIRFTDVSGEVVVDVECADTDTDDTVILGGTIEDGGEMSGLIALSIRDGDPDSVAIWLDNGENQSCSELLANRRDVFDDDSEYVQLEDGNDIETG